MSDVCITVDVTFDQIHMRASNECNGGNCPLYYAIQPLISKRIWITTTKVEEVVGVKNFPAICNLPEAAVDFVNLFDKGIHVDPIKFDLWVPPHYLIAEESEAKS